MRLSRMLVGGAVLALSVMGAAQAAQPAPAPVAQAVCGGARFSVQLHNDGHPLTNVYRLYGQPDGASQAPRLLYTGDEGGWFYAACVQAPKGPVLLFQSFCGGSVCVEDRFGVVDARTLKILLRPDKANVGNEKKARAILGKDVPDLAKDKASFCCDSPEEAR